MKKKLFICSIVATCVLLVLLSGIGLTNLFNSLFYPNTNIPLAQSKENFQLYYEKVKKLTDSLGYHVENYNNSEELLSFTVAKEKCYPIDINFTNSSGEETFYIEYGGKNDQGVPFSKFDKEIFIEIVNCFSGESLSSKVYESVYQKFMNTKNEATYTHVDKTFGKSGNWGIFYTCSFNPLDETLASKGATIGAVNAIK